VGVADTRRGEATAYVTPALAQERARFRFGVLEMLTLVLVTMRDRHPVHAAAIKRNGGALLLAGPPGAGKSTLAYLASRHGADLLSDDAAYIQLAPRFRVWAVPGCVRLLPDACARFPELQGRSPVSLPNGDDKVPVEVSVGGAFAVPVEGRAAVCLLERDRGPVTLLPASPGEIEEALADGLGPARTLYKGETARAHARLASGGGWRLGLSDDPRETLPHLDAMLDAVAHREC
jgi:hypothetical protein